MQGVLSECVICEHLVPVVVESLRERPIVVVYENLPDGARTLSIDSARLVQMVDSAVPNRYRVRVTPFLFAIDGLRKVRSRGLVNTYDQVLYHASQIPEISPMERIVS